MTDKPLIELRKSGPAFLAQHDHVASVHRRLAAMAELLKHCGQSVRVGRHYGYEQVSGYVGRSFHQISYLPDRLDHDGTEGANDANGTDRTEF
jgi:hypothetical protein